MLTVDTEGRVNAPGRFQASRVMTLADGAAPSWLTTGAGTNDAASTYTWRAQNSTTGLGGLVVATSAVNGASASIRAAAINQEIPASAQRLRVATGHGGSSTRGVSFGIVDNPNAPTKGVVAFANASNPNGAYCVTLRAYGAGTSADFHTWYEWASTSGVTFDLSLWLDIEDRAVYLGVGDAFDCIWPAAPFDTATSVLPFFAVTSSSAAVKTSSVPWFGIDTWYA